MEVIAISSSDSDDDMWEDVAEHLRKEIHECSPSVEDNGKIFNLASQPTIRPDDSCKFDLGGVGNVTLEDDARHSIEYAHESSALNGCSYSQRVSFPTERSHKTTLTHFGQTTHTGSSSGQRFDETADGMENDAIEPVTEQNYKGPLKTTTHLGRGSAQNVGDNENYLSTFDMQPPKEDIHRRILPRSILPMWQPKGHIQLTVNESNNNTLKGKGQPSKDYTLGSSQKTMIHCGDSNAQYCHATTDIQELEAKPSMPDTQKRMLPPWLQPTISATVTMAPIENTNDVQIIDCNGKLGSFAERMVANQKCIVKDNIDRKDEHAQIYEHEGHRRHLPSWMSRGSATGKLATSSAMSSLSTHPDNAGIYLGFEDRSMEEDERLIFQAALQDIAQPKYEVDLPAALLTVPLLRHQRIGLAWMQKKETGSHCPGGILADDQGLGKTISTIALIQMERLKQVKFSSNNSGYIKFDALNLEDESDRVLPEDEKTRHSEVNFKAKPHKSHRSYDHSGHSTSEVMNLVEIDDEHHEFDVDFGDDVKRKTIESDTSNLAKLDVPLPKMKQTKRSEECSTSKKVRTKNSTKPAVHKGRPPGGTLVVCPASILRQWAREIDEKVPEGNKLSVLVYHGSGRSKDPSFLAKHDVVLTTYSIVTNEVPKQPLSIVDEEQKNTEKYALSSEFSPQKKRKKTSDAHKRGKNKKKGASDSSFSYDSGPLARVHWFRVVLDESQTIKNFRTQVSRACCGLRAKRRWCLSGTPLQNSLDDLYSYFRFLRYDPYSAYSSFCASIKNPITRNATTGYMKLQAVLRTIMLRRTKGTLIDGEPIIKLPPKSICLKKIFFSPEERAFYLNLEADSRQKFKAFAAAGTVNQNYASILVLLLRLRQACDHPLLVKEYHSGPVARASLKTAQQLPMEMLTDLLNRLEASSAICSMCSDPPEDGCVTMCGHVFCYQCISGYLTGEDNFCPATGCKGTLGADSVFSGATLRNGMFGEPEEGSPGASRCLDPSFHSSSKLEAAVDILRSICKVHCPKPSGGHFDENFPSPHGSSMTLSEVYTDTNVETSEIKPSTLSSELPVKAIVFSQWTSMLDLLEISLNHSLIQYRRLDGTMTLVSRDRAVKDFNTDQEVNVMIMSLKAGNLGLNMIAACHVILLDPWWNPTSEDQAIDRAHRIGQTRPVTVFRLTVSDTVEDRILALQEKKREMVSSAFGEDQSGGRSTRLTPEDLRFLFNV